MPATNADDQRPDGPDDELDDVPESELSESPHSPQGEHLAKLHALEQRGRSGANWFYWVAALSAVNSAIMLGGSETYFVIGLAVSKIVDVMGAGLAQAAPEAAMVMKVGSFLVSLAISGAVALFGWLAGRRNTIVFMIGMFLYVLDGLLWVLFQDWMSVAFHAFALFGMWSGLSAFRELRSLESISAVEQAPA